jgi:polysaccharide biosynthesis protein PslG
MSCANHEETLIVPLLNPAKKAQDGEVRQFWILFTGVLAAAPWSKCAEVLRLDPQAKAAFSRPARAELGLIGVNVHRLRGNASLDFARQAGFRFARVDLLWERVERGGAYRFQAYDALMSALEARGMGALLILDYGHPDHGGGVPRTAGDIAAFGRFAGAAATRFKGRDVRYEIWNEPDIVQFWRPKPDAREYAALLREAVSAIQRADPAAKVVSGGVSRLDLKFLRKAIDPAGAAGLAAIGLHPYPEAGPETIGPQLEKLRLWARQSFGERLEVWDTEWGYSSTNVAERTLGDGHSEEARLRQARLAIREILTVWSVGFPLAVWYDLQDDGTDAGNPEQNYGLLDANGAPKPAMQAMRTLMSAVKDRQYAGAIQRTPPGLHAMRFDGPADVLFIVWNDRPAKRQRIQYTKENLVSVTNLMGAPVQSALDSSHEAQMEIDEASGPVNLLWKYPPAHSERLANDRPVAVAKAALRSRTRPKATGSAAPPSLLSIRIQAEKEPHPRL